MHPTRLSEIVRALSKKIAQFFARRLASSAAPRSKSARRFQPQVEMLEDKIVPSAATMQPTFVILQHASAGTGPVAGYSPQQILTAYGITGTLLGGSQATGSGQTIAIVDAYNDPNIVGDLDTFDEQFSSTSGGSTLYTQYGAASTFLTVYNQTGQVINPSNTSVPVDSTGNWEVEEALDVEWAHAIAPGARIDLIEASSNANSNLYSGVTAAANLSGVSVVTMSWGAPDAASETGSDGIFTTPSGHQGVTFVAATGDGSFGEYPAYSPNVIAVGGTTLTLNANNSTIASETAWSTGSDSYAPTDGTGGGTSKYEAEPAYQQGFQSTGYRTVPDVAMDANPSTGVAVYDSYDNSTLWLEVGGTSLAAPSFAGVMAMANQGRVLNGLGTFNSSSNPQQALTALYSMSSSDFNDITSGSITYNGTTYNAGPGYDEVSGRGSPAAGNLIPGLASYGLASPATQLAFTAEPPLDAVIGAAFTTTVQIESAGGGYVSQSGTNITLTLAGGLFSNGTNTITVATGTTGQASFSATITSAGTGICSLTAAPPAGSTLTPASSTSFAAVTPQLVFTTEPAGTVAAGTAFSTAVQLETSSGALVQQAGITVTLTLSTGTFSNGSKTASALTSSSGLASFSLTMSTAGSTQYTLTPSTTAPVMSGPASSAFEVAASNKLAFTTEPPSSVASGTKFSTLVQLENPSGSAVKQSGVSVTVTVYSSTGTVIASGSGTSNSSGQVTFNVTVAPTGTGDYLTATATNYTAAQSTTFTVTAASKKAAVLAPAAGSTTGTGSSTGTGSTTGTGSAGSTGGSSEPPPTYTSAWEWLLQRLWWDF